MCVCVYIDGYVPGSWKEGYLEVKWTGNFMKGKSV